VINCSLTTILKQQWRIQSFYFSKCPAETVEEQKKKAIASYFSNFSKKREKFNNMKVHETYLESQI